MKKERKNLHSVCITQIPIVCIQTPKRNFLEVSLDDTFLTVFDYKTKQIINILEESDKIPQIKEKRSKKTI